MRPLQGLARDSWLWPSLHSPSWLTRRRGHSCSPHTSPTRLQGREAGCRGLCGCGWTQAPSQQAQPQEGDWPLPAHSPPESLSCKTIYLGEGRPVSAEREVLGAEVVPAAQQAPCRDELQRHGLRPLLPQVPLKHLKGQMRGRSPRPLCPSPQPPARPCTLTSNAVSSRSGAMLTSGRHGSWLMTLAALDTSGW